MLKVALIGFGAIGQEVARILSQSSETSIVQIVVPSPLSAEAVAMAENHAPDAIVTPVLFYDGPLRPELVAECAGHAAIEQHVIPALKVGIPSIIASVGALGQSELLAQIEAAARQASVRVQLISGAIGGMDVLAAASVAGVEEVTYIGRKPPRSWANNPAAQSFDLERVTTEQVIFQGSAGEAALLYPQNANVAAAIGLSGIGMEKTYVRLIADPRVERNVHMVEARGDFGHFTMELSNLPLERNLKTSALAAYSLARAIRNSQRSIYF